MISFIFMQIQSYILVVIDMYINAAVGKAGTVFKALAALAVCVSILIFSESCSKGALNGISLCLNVLVPSLFPFMAASSFIVKSGLAQKIGKPLGRITKALFGLSGSFAPVILLSMLGGYPVGAKGISELAKSGAVPQKEAQKAALFSVCAGPGFIINFVGASLYNNKTVGLIILCSQIISVILLGIIINLFDKSKSEDCICAESFNKPCSVGTAIVESALDSSKGILGICAFVVLFSAFIEIIGQIISDSSAENMLCCLLEVCSAVNRLSQNCTLEMTAFAIGFGGLCVHFQIYSALGKVSVSKLLFFCIRIIQGIFTALLTHFGAMLFLGTSEVFSTSKVETSQFYGGTVISAAVLIGVAICFLYSIKAIRQK